MILVQWCWKFCNKLLCPHLNLINIKQIKSCHYWTKLLLSSPFISQWHQQHLFSHASPFYLAYRGQCLCYSGKIKIIIREVDQHIGHCAQTWAKIGGICTFLKHACVEDLYRYHIINISLSPINIFKNSRRVHLCKAWHHEGSEEKGSANRWVLK